MSETDILLSTLLGLQEAFPDALWYRRNVGATKFKGRLVRFGMAGQADIGGIVCGRAVEVEIKTKTGMQTKDQKNWQRAVEKAGGVYILARSVEEAVSAIRSSFYEIWHTQSSFTKSTNSVFHYPQH